MAHTFRIHYEATTFGPVYRYFFTICFILTSAVLVYFIVHLARIKHMNGASKAAWIVFMTFAAPLAFPVYWFAEIRNEPDYVPMHPDIA